MCKSKKLARGACVSHLVQSQHSVQEWITLINTPAPHHTHTHTHTYTHTHVHTHTHTHTHTPTHHTPPPPPHTHTHTTHHTHTRTRTHTHSQTYAHTRTRTHAQTYTHTHAHTHTHTHTNTEAPFTRKTVTSATNTPIPLSFTPLSLSDPHLILSHHFSGFLLSSLLFPISFCFHLSLIFTPLSYLWPSSANGFLPPISPLSIFTSPLFFYLYSLMNIIIYSWTLFILQLDALELSEWAIKRRDLCVEGYTCTHTHTSTHPSQIVFHQT